MAHRCSSPSSSSTPAWTRWAGLARIGIDEISDRKGRRHLTVVVDHDSGRLLDGWAVAVDDRGR